MMNDATTKEPMDIAVQLYKEKLRPVVETPENIGKFIAIDSLTGDYEVNRNMVQAVLTLRSRHTDPQACALRVGYETTFSRGGWMKRLPPIEVSS